MQAQMRLVAELRAEIVRLSAHAKEQEERLAEALDTIKLLKRRLYSASRERYIADPASSACLIRWSLVVAHPRKRETFLIRWSLVVAYPRKRQIRATMRTSPPQKSGSLPGSVISA